MSAQPLGVPERGKKILRVPHLLCLQIVSSLGDPTVLLFLSLWIFRDFPKSNVSSLSASRDH